MVGNDFLHWLVANRSRNQAGSLRLFDIAKAHGQTIRSADGLPGLYIILTSISFSQWRAVFLADVKGDLNEPALIAAAVDNTDAFLENLIHHNAVGYAQDRAARGFAFIYYMNNTRSRLRLLQQELFGKEPLAGHDLDLETGITAGAQKWWEVCQAGFEVAVDRFEKLVAPDPDTV